MRRVRRLAAAALVATLAAGGAGGCRWSPLRISVAGTDRAGNPVVGAEDCSVGGSRLDSIVVTTQGEYGEEEIWAISEPWESSSSAYHAPDSGRRPRPEPRRLADVDLVAVGEGQPAGWDVDTPLQRPLPEVGFLSVEVSEGFESDLLEIDLGAPPDTWSALIDGEPVVGLGASELAARIDAECDEATYFSWGTFWAIFGPTLAGVVALWVGAGVLAARRFRRAGEARARKRGGPS